MNRAELLEKLEQVGRALATNNLIPVMQSFCFDGKRVIASNDALTIIAPCKTEEQFIVNGKVLLGLLSASKEEEVDFKIDGREILVTMARTKAKLPFDPVEAFLFKQPEMDDGWDLMLDPSEGIEACLLTAATDTTQQAFMGVLVNGSIYSTDGDSITRYSWGLKPTNQLQPYMMSSAFCETVLKLAEGKVSKIFLSPGWSYAKIGTDGPSQDIEYEVWGRLIDPPIDEGTGQPLDFEDVINKTAREPGVFSPIPPGLNDALSRARVVADHEGKPTKLTVENARSGTKLRILTEASQGVVQDVLIFNQHEVTALVSAELMQRCIKLTKQMLILDNCCIFVDVDNKLFILLSNFN